MARRRDPSPFGSRERDTPDFPRWMMIDAGGELLWKDGERRGRLKPDFFRMLREFRFTRTRLIAEAVALIAGVVLFSVLPVVAAAIVVPAVVAGIVDLVLFTHLRRRIIESLQDLSSGS